MSAAVATAARSRRTWIGGLACGACLAFTPASALFLATLLAPSILMHVLDPHPQRATTRAVLLFGLAATVGPLATLWSDGPPPIEAALDRLSRLAVVAGAWAAAGAAWLVAEGATIGAGFWLARRDRARIAAIDSAIAQLEAEWEPAGTAG